MQPCGLKKSAQASGAQGKRTSNPGGSAEKRGGHTQSRRVTAIVAVSIRASAYTVRTAFIAPRSVAPLSAASSTISTNGHCGSCGIASGNVTVRAASGRLPNRDSSTRRVSVTGLGNRRNIHRTGARRLKGVPLRCDFAPTTSIPCHCVAIWRATSMPGALIPTIRSGRPHTESISEASERESGLSDISVRVTTRRGREVFLSVVDITGKF